MKRQRVHTAFYVVVILFLACQSSHAETVKITNGEWAPYLSEHLPENGFASDVVRAAFDAAGLSVEYGFYPWKRAFKLARQGDWHGSVVWVYTPERARDFFFSDTVVTDSEYLFHLKSFKLEWQRPEDLQDVRIGGTLHTVYPAFKAAEDQGIITIERTGTYENLYRRLLKKRIHAIPQVSAVGEFLIRTTLTPDQQAQITMSPTIIQTRRYALILSKAIPENKHILERFNRGLKHIRLTGIYREMLDRLKRGGYDPVPVSKSAL